MRALAAFSVYVFASVAPKRAETSTCKYVTLHSKFYMSPIQLKCIENVKRTLITTVKCHVKHHIRFEYIPEVIRGNCWPENDTIVTFNRTRAPPLYHQKSHFQNVSCFVFVKDQSIAEIINIGLPKHVKLAKSRTFLSYDKRLLPSLYKAISVRLMVANHSDAYTSISP